MFISGTSGHAAEDTQHKYPYMVDGRLLRLNFTKNIYQLNLQQSTGGTITGSPLSGASGTQFNLSATANNKYTFDGFSVTGAALTGSAGTYTNSDVTAKGNWTYHPSYTFTALPMSAASAYKYMICTPESAAVPSANPPTVSIGASIAAQRDANGEIAFMPAMFNTWGSDHESHYSAYSARPGYNFTMLKQNPIRDTVSVGMPGVGTVSFGAVVGVRGLELSSRNIGWSSYYGTTADRNLVATGTFKWSEMSGNYEEQLIQEAYWFYNRINPFSGSYIALDRDKYFTLKCDAMFRIYKKDAEYLHGMQWANTGAFLSAGYGKME